MDELFAAIKALWNANTALTNAFKNAITAGEVTELSSLPNVMIRPLTQVKKTQSNKTLYEECAFDIEIADSDFERLGMVSKLMIDAVRYAKLNQYLLTNNSRYTLQILTSPTTVWAWEERYWKATSNFSAQISSTVAPSGGS